MSTQIGQMLLRGAMLDAEALRDLFSPAFYSSWTFAGEVRRRCSYISSVEHVVVPRTGEIDVPDSLFGEKQRVNLLWQRLDNLVKHSVHVERHVYGGVNGDGVSHFDPPPGYVKTHFKWGDKVRGLSFRGYRHEIHVADGDNLGLQLAICTGPGKFNKMMFNKLQQSGLWSSGGYVVNKNDISCANCGWRGGWNNVRFAKVADGAPEPLFTNGDGDAVLCGGCRRGDGLSMPRVPVPTERDYFARCGVEFIQPPNRRDPVVRR